MIRSFSLNFHQACWLASVNQSIVGTIVSGMLVTGLVVVPLGKWAEALSIADGIPGIAKATVEDASGPMEVVLLLQDYLGAIFIQPF